MNQPDLGELTCTRNVTALLGSRLDAETQLAQVRAYQVYLVSSGASWASFNVAVSALRFFYGVTLGPTAMVDRIPYARKQRQLPVILSADEVARFLTV
jgi:hypothetical protein